MSRLVLSFILFLNLTASAEENCGIPKAETPREAGLLILGVAEQSAADICAGQESSKPSPEAEAELLNGIRAGAVADMNRAAERAGMSANDAGTAEDWKSLRVMMALQQIDAGYSDDKLDMQIPSKPFHTLGFASRPEPLSSVEKSRAFLALEKDRQAFEAEAQDYVRAETAEMTALGMNPEAGVATGLGDRKEKFLAGIRAAGKTGYHELVARNPVLLFMTKADATAGDVADARGRYAEALVREANSLSRLQTAPPENAALPLVLYEKNTREVLAQNPAKYCGAFSSLKDRLARDEKWKAIANTAVGVTAGAVCAVAAAYSAGLLGAGCFAATASEITLATYSAGTSWRQANTLYGKMLKGESMDAYVEKRKAAFAYMAAAGLSTAGGIGSSISIANRLSRGEKAIASVAEPSEMTVESYSRFKFRGESYDSVVAKRREEYGLSIGEGDYVLRASPQAKGPIADEIRELEKLGINVHDFGRGSVKEGFEFNTKIRMINVNEDFYRNPQLTLKRLREAREKALMEIELKKHGVEMTTARGSAGASKTDTGYELKFDENSAKALPNGHPLKWMANRFNRHRVRVVVDDTKFTGKLEKAGAFAEGNTVYLRSSTMKNLEQQKDIVSHELSHAYNYAKCQNQGDCSGLIAFKPAAGSNVKLSEHELYEDFFRGDEVTTYALSSRFRQSPAYIDHARDFGRRQQDYLTRLRDTLSSGDARGVIHNQVGSSYVFKVDTPDGPVEILFDRIVRETDGRATKKILADIDRQLQTVRLRLRMLDRLGP